MTSSGRPPPRSTWWNYNGVNDYIHFGKSGELASNRREEQELFMLCLHILQSSLGFVNTLMIQDVLAQPEWADVLGDADQRGLPPLFTSNMTPYGDRYPARHQPPPGHRRHHRPAASGTCRIRRGVAAAAGSRNQGSATAASLRRSKARRGRGTTTGS